MFLVKRPKPCDLILYPLYLSLSPTNKYLNSNQKSLILHTLQQYIPLFTEKREKGVQTIPTGACPKEKASRRGNLGSSALYIERGRELLRKLPNP